MDEWKPKPIKDTLTPEQDDAINVYLTKLAGFLSGTSHACPVCGAEVTGSVLYAGIEPDSFSLYVQPCNHRLGLWEKAPNWITDVRVVPFDDEEES